MFSINTLVWTNCREGKKLFKTKKNVVRKADAYSAVMNTLRLNYQRKEGLESFLLGALGAKRKLVLYEACKVYEKYCDIKGFKCGILD